MTTHCGDSDDESQGRGGGDEQLLLRAKSHDILKEVVLHEPFARYFNLIAIFDIDFGVKV